MGFFQRREAANSQGFRVDQVDFLGLRDLQELHREAFKRRRHLHRNSYRKCRPPHLPSTPVRSEAVCSATHTFGWTTASNSGSSRYSSGVILLQGSDGSVSSGGTSVLIWIGFARSPASKADSEENSLGLFSLGVFYGFISWYLSIYRLPSNWSSA